MKSLIIFLIGFLPVFANAEFDIKKLNAVTNSPDYLQGKFIQQKYLQDFDMSIESNGTFHYSKNERVHWQTLEPIENLVVMTPNSIVSSQGNTQVMSLQADTNPVVTLLSDLFFSVLTSQWQNLETYFSLTGEVNGQVWKVQLVPKDATLAQAITRVELQGEKHLKFLKFFESNGDYTEINFIELSQTK